MDRTIANLRDVAPTAYFNVPRGFELLLPALREDDSFCRHFFSRARMLFFAAATLRPEIADSMQRLAIASTGRPVPWITGLGATESAPFALCTGPLLSTATHVGCLAGLGEGGPRIAACSKRACGVQHQAGSGATTTDPPRIVTNVYRMAIDRARLSGRPDRGVDAFRGRVREDFKLSTGTGSACFSACASFSRRWEISPRCRRGGHGAQRVAVWLFQNLPPGRTSQAVGWPSRSRRRGSAGVRRAHCPTNNLRAVHFESTGAAPGQPHRLEAWKSPIRLDQSTRSAGATAGRGLALGDATARRTL